MAMIGNGHDLIVSHPMHLQPFIKTTSQMSKFVALLLSAHVVPTPGCGGGHIGGGADKNLQPTWSYFRPSNVKIL